MAIRAVRKTKEVLNRTVGWHVLFEARNKVLLGPSAVALRRAEDREVNTLRPRVQPASALVATVIPTYRRPEALAAAVSSVLGQTMGDLTVIVVDDGAGLPDLPDDPRLIAVSLTRNIGIAGVVRNVGIRLTRSRYVAFLDDDNTWEPDHLERALGELESDERLGAVYTALRRIHPDGSEMDVLSVPHDRALARRKAFFDTNAFVARRDRDLIFSRLRRTPDVLPREDWELIYRYGRRHRILHIPHPTVRYVVNPDTYYTDWQQGQG